MIDKRKCALLLEYPISSSETMRLGKGTSVKIMINSERKTNMTTLISTSYGDGQTITTRAALDAELFLFLVTISLEPEATTRYYKLASTNT